MVESSDEVNANMIEVPLTAALKQALLDRQEALGRNGLRVIGMCCRTIKSNQDNSRKEEKTSDDLDGFPSSGYCFLGMFSLIDPHRPEVPAAVMKAHQAGIRISMVTGDHAATATAIAKHVNIIPSHIQDKEIYKLRLAQDGLDRAIIEIIQGETTVYSHLIGSNTILRLDTKKNDRIEEEQLETEEEKEEITDGKGKTKDCTLCSRLYRYVFSKEKIEPRITSTETAIIVTGMDIKLFDKFMWKWVLTHRYVVFARTSPEQKLKIVAEAQALHEVVAVTGDGVNDAPALKQSDLGIAMQAGADVAREAGDLILLDNNFSSIINAIETGRVVSDNLKKVCLYLMVGGTYCEALAVAVNVFFGLPLPLSSFQMLIICVFTDIFDALALVQEQPESAIMSRPPVDRRFNKLVDYKMVIQAYLFYGNICTFSAMLCYFWYLQEEAGLHANCLLFAYNYQTGGNYTCSYDSTVNLTPNQQNEYLFTAQSIYFVSILITNWFQMLATRTRYSSIFEHNPLYGKGQNLWLFASMIFGICIAVFVLNVSWFNTVFHTRPVPIKYIAPALGFGAALLLLDELRKYHVRSYPKGLLARIAW